MKGGVFVGAWRRGTWEGMGSITHKKGRNWLDKWPYLYPESNEATFASVYDCGSACSMFQCACVGVTGTHMLFYHQNVMLHFTCLHF